ncbi:hypothetical protein NMG60_11019754 [Bertholletia excelsa]
MEKKEEIHVLMVAFSSQGHINPMLRFGRRLISKSLHVTLATTEIVRHRMLTSSADTVTKSVAGINLEFFSDGLPLDYDRKSNLDHLMDSLGRAGRTNLSAIIGCGKFSCVIANPFVPWVASVAAEHGLPCALLWIQPCTLFSIYHRFYNNLNLFPTLENPDMSVELPGLPLLKTEELPTFVLPSNPFGSIPKLFADLFKNIKSVRWVLTNSFHELETQVIESMSEIHRVLPVGPLVPPVLLGDDESADVGFEMWKSDNTCVDWLNQWGPSSVVYVSFGSITVLQAKQMESVAEGLKSSGRPFLWVVKRSDAAMDGGRGELPAGFSDETKSRGLVVPWSPQIEVLKHPAVGCFLSHCGWNSLLETVSAGVPVIAYPQWSDQPTIAKLVSDVLIIGVRVRPNEDGEVTGEEVRRCIEEVVSGPSSEEFRKNAAALKVAARKAVSSDGSSDRNIQLFVDEITGNASSGCSTRTN